MTRLLPLQPVALGAEVIDFVEHPVEQRLGRGGGYAGALKLPDLTALPLNLATHVLYFAANELEQHSGRHDRISVGRPTRSFNKTHLERKGDRSLMMLPAHRRMLTEHLPYELDMLEWSYAALHDDELAAFKDHMLIGNLAIESFWTHARNLIEFFNYPRNGSESGIASASDFVKSPRFDPQLDLTALIEEVNTQITHLQYERPSTFEEKLNSARMAYVRDAINKAVKLFEADMTPEAKAIWKARAPLQITVTTGSMTACTVMSSTASVGSISVVGQPRSPISVTAGST